MTPLRSPALLLALLAPLSAQTKNPVVEDLLHARMRLHARHRGVVTALPRPGDEPWLRIHGELHLMPTLYEDSLVERLPGALTESALSEILVALREALADRIEFHDLGATTLLDTEYPEQAAGLLELVRGAIPEPVRCHVRLTRETEAGSEVLLEDEVAFVDGRTHVLADSARRPVLFDFEVEIAAATSTARPIVHPLSSGTSIVARVRPLPFGEDAIVEAVVRTADPSGSETWTPHSGFGPLTRARSRIDEAGVAFRIRRGGATVHEWRTLEGATLRLSWHGDWRPTEPRVEGHTILATALLRFPVLGFRNDLPTNAEEPYGATWIGRLVERAIDHAPPDSVVYLDTEAENRGVLVLAPNGERFGRDLVTRIDALLTPLRVTVEAFDSPHGGDWTDGTPPADARPVLRVSGPVLADHPVTFASVREQSYVSGWYTEVAQAARIPDPSVDVLEEGWSLTIRPTRTRGGAVDRCDVDLRLGRLVAMHALETRLAPATLGLASVGATDPTPAVWLPEEIVQVELPELASVRIEDVVDLTDGQAVLRHSATGLYGKGREIVVRLRVE